MRLHSFLVLGTLLGGAHAQIVGRQQDENTTTATAPSETEAEPSTTAAPPPSDTSTSAGNDDDDEDTTVTRTTTVQGEADTVTRQTTVDRTSTRTQTVTSTEFSTTTVTNEDAETATSTVRETTTVWERRRRDLAIDLAPRTAVPTVSYPAWAPVPTTTEDALQLRDNTFGKRDTITVVRTVTDGGNDGTTVVQTATRVVFTTVEEEETTTSVITSTVQVNARTTTTITQTLTVTSTSVSTGQLETSTQSSQETSGAGSGGGGNDDSGLSTGEQVGIGVGVGVGGLLLLGLVGWWFLRRRRGSKPDHDDLIGASEVPVGPSGGHSSSGAGGVNPGMAEHNTAAAFLAPNRTAGNKPPFSQEGYRGTAMGDGRAGYAKPVPYGAAYAGAGGTNSTSPGTAYSQPTNRSSTLIGDQLPPHPSPPHSAELGHDGGAARWADPNATEIDSRAVTHQHTGPVYEMAGQNYR
ncbi:hypothetical protein S7711_08379 [Stachybotrys chartarum IBT 7711]|uniref:Mid2 domain-containing protein n=1 Tax=Stachybotrys chartarum (strain CBS 109288 / IBT 7711) TaxID=1280523 RepID=A0A084ARU1_STACB|nr:hypothetical protein S7711_08379 [Stachybotrys chartarum IBT 7711]KFA54077.1 hypothetical protein S40293_05528 [Stachybotrys chartarum IBT 40293]